ncbi:MAG: hypothetical protein MZW92_44555 [Comamonadaceae bacterium]|nr:hypothetical protein [Comamonadaceae bacterium]
MPLVLLGLVVAHIIALHDVGSNNPDGVEIKAKKDPKTGIPLDGIPFHPYYTVHDIIGVGGVPDASSSRCMFFAPEMGGYFLEYNNFIPADPLKTPAHIAPVWYFTPYYSMLRAVTDPMVSVLRRACVALAARAGRAQGRPGAHVRRWRVLVGARGALIGAAQALRRQVLGRGGDGRGGDDPVRAALARPQPGEVDPLPPGLAQVAATASSSSTSWCSATSASQPPSADRHADLAGRHAVLLRLLPADAVVEPHRRVQAGARPRDLRSRTEPEAPSR